MAAEDKRTILLDVEINQSNLVKESENAIKQIERIKEEQQALKDENKQGGIQYAVLRAEMSKYNRVISENAKNIVRINDLTNKETLTRKELFEMQKILAAQYNSLTAEQLQNEEGAQKIAEAYKKVNEQLQESGRDVSDYRLLVGSYRKELDGLLSSQNAMRQEQSKIGFVINESEEKIKDLNGQLESLDKNTIGYAQAEAKLVSEINEVNSSLEQQKKVYSELGTEIDETTERTKEIEAKAQKIGFTMKSTDTIVNELKSRFLALRLEISNTTGDTSNLEEKLIHVGKRLESFGIDLGTLEEGAKSNSTQFVSLGETMDQLREKGMKLDFKGVMTQLNGLAEISGKLTFAEVKKGAKEFGQTMINLGKNLLKNPLFLIALTITAAVLAYKEWTEANKKAGKELDKFNAKMERQNKIIGLNNDLRKESTSVMLELARIQGQSASKIYDLQKKQIEDEIKFNKESEALSKQRYQRLSDIQMKALQEGDDEVRESAKNQMKAEQDKWNGFIVTNRQANNKLILLEAQYNADLKTKNKEAVANYKERMAAILKIHKETLNRIEDLNNENAKLSIENEQQELNNVFDLQKRFLELTLREKLNNIALVSENEDKANVDSLKATDEHLQSVLNLERERFDALLKLRNDYYNASEKELESAAKREIESSEAKGEDLVQLEDALKKNLLLKKKELTEELNNENKNIIADFKDMEQDILENWAAHQKALLEEEKNRLQVSKELNQKLLEDQIAIVEQLAQLSTQAMASMFDYLRNKIEVENAKLDGLFEKNKQGITDQYEHGFLTEQEYLDKSAKLEKDYQLKKYLIEKKAFENEKQQAMLETGINTAVAVMKAYATTGPIAGPLLAAIIGGIGAVQLGLIGAKKFPSEVPGYAIGGLVKDGDGTPINRSNGDNILATVKKGEVILNKKQQAMLGGDSIFKAIGVPGFAGGGLANNLQIDRVNRDNSTSSIVGYISKLPRPVVSVQDINSKLVESIEVENSSKF